MLILAAAVVAVLVGAFSQRGDSVPLAALSAAPGASGSPAAATPGAREAAPADLLVHVSGAVRAPGIVTLSPGARVVDAVAAAGGLTDEGDAAGVNLARPVADGEQLIVPRHGETVPQAGTSATTAGGGPGGTVNLNTASLTELQTLPRIGPAIAQRIVDWRSANGRFRSVSDLLQVAGVGQKLFDGVKDKVTV